MNKEIIHITKLYKQYKGADFFSVNDLNLSIAENDIFGLLGPNGAGKTTLLSILCGLVKPTSGTFTIDGLTYSNDAQKIKQNIGVVPQEYALYPTLTARENLLYFGSMLGLKGNELKTKVDQLLEHLGLLKFAHKRVETFSGGMKRRVNLIAGILHDPKVLFLDEPTVGVDVQSKNVIINFLKELNTKGTTIIYTSHHLTEAQDFCNKIAIIDRGTIFAEGTPDELIQKTPDAYNLEDVFIALTGKELRDNV
ncbi:MULTISPECIES: ABC transporter ATP-binding protein [Flavobacterium]|uniref:ABC transporter ATP-binding protein n=2 Tax=Flavobacterium TaxID=237 RepID=A0AA94JPP7_9FLAO|nr:MULTISPECIES: ABC transporter ATP-binding protein [Flavobacterium]OXA81531.1 ABC transporter ATP-binding protein [Flavobacterium columnare NBRC 100251 = ATCC 23463]AMA48510.1 ABC transporter ATP-binding protein [Flavobacterium covae]AND65362.1 ABC transporter ATP-binding protein [Flavobacterium covae]MCH4830459.1 ABC transporter ATP-binding protein [Flavobacterium columnare]MCH4833605.1 ABC transporter ATP-binding protein [Flavobacterium columnare]